MVDRGSNFSFFKDIHIANGWYFYFHKTYDHQNCTAGTSKEFDSLKTNETGTGDVITLKSRNFN